MSMSSLETRLDQQAKSAAAVADGVLLRVRHLRGRSVLADRLEAGIVAVAALSARRPDDGTIERAMHHLEMLVGPGERQHAVEGGDARCVRIGYVTLGELVLDAAHAHHCITVRPFPVGRVDTRLAAQRMD